LSRLFQIRRLGQRDRLVVGFDERGEGVVKIFLRERTSVDLEVRWNVGVVGQGKLFLEELVPLKDDVASGDRVVSFLCKRETGTALPVTTGGC
jgi:hypothetical protein